MNALVGYTGFVGSNIYAKGCFDGIYNSKNIAEAFGLSPELLIYAGLRAEKFLANRDADADMQHVLEAKRNIDLIAPKKLVLISTIDVFRSPLETDEDSLIETNGLHAYGLNRYRFEQMVRQDYPDALIVRLPGLYGNNIKKNFIYDMINVIPSMLNEAKYSELCGKVPGLREHYTLQSNGYYKCGSLTHPEHEELKRGFAEAGFTALDFTDSRSVYQFYPLHRLWDDINTSLKNDIRLLHTATEPVSAAELYFYVTGEKFTNETNGQPARYNYITKHGNIFKKTGGYILSREEVLADIKKFIEGYNANMH